MQEPDFPYPFFGSVTNNIQACIRRDNTLYILLEGNSMISKSEQIRGKGVPFERVRRITGYLVGGMERWNSAKASEEHERVKHKI